MQLKKMSQDKIVAKEFIGLDIFQHPTHKLVNQARQIMKAVEPSTFPKLPTALAEDVSRKVIDPTLCKALVEILNYIATGSRPDICFAVHISSAKTHINLAKRRSCKIKSVWFKNKKHSRLEPKMHVIASFAIGFNEGSIFGHVFIRIE